MKHVISYVLPMKHRKLAILPFLIAVVTIFGIAAPASAVVRGQDATEPYPFMGAYKTELPTPPGAGGNGCGVTLLDERWAITAAHCLKNNFAKNGSPVGWTVQFGSADVTEGGETVAVERFFRANDESFWGKDLMMLRLAKAVDLAPARLASSTPAPGTPARMLGWGSTSEDTPMTYPSQLQEADVTILDDAKCTTAAENEICAGIVDGEASDVPKAGNADSGGPLLVKENGAWALAGILSGPEEQYAGAAGLYTDATTFADWIHTIMTTFESIPDDAVDTGMMGFPAIEGCQSSIVKAAESRDQDPALLLTNGHCVPIVEPDRERPAVGKTISDQPTDASLGFTDAQGYVLTKAHIDRLVFATMSGTDVAVYRLDKSFAQLQDEGVRVLKIAKKGPSAGDRVTLMTADPLSCQIEAVVPTLREDGYEQHDALRMKAGDDCETFPGFSGAALVAPDGETVVGINNSNNREGEKCTENGPCEVGAGGKIEVFTNQAYGQQVALLNDCITGGSGADLDAAGCDLGAEAQSSDASADTVLWVLTGAGLLVLASAVLTVLVARRRSRRSV